MSRTQPSTCIIHSHHSGLEIPPSSAGHGGVYRTGTMSKHRRHRTAPPPSNRFSDSSFINRPTPLKTGVRPPTIDQYSNIICGIHTSANLPPYKSPADECLPQIQDPKGLENTMLPKDEADKAVTALVLAQAVRSTTHAHQVYLRRQLIEGEVVLDILRKKIEDSESRLQQADLQLGSLRGMLYREGLHITEAPDDYMLEHHELNEAYNESVADDDDNEECVDDDSDKEDGEAAALEVGKADSISGLANGTGSAA